eukprot:CAMPEP_0185735864 /NCGR_PEP_ID=MMETSP1171-20130828/26303_1 /TAXON_ID=374046 /ORGANISM="Helicotheca tamensis, Strain CCMP826" /LENGTH=574 /DNA_ID=CAMNT_0028406299 /DNA_START=184 /DNA_END=1908 /DNA_ORIENTATION=-
MSSDYDARPTIAVIPPKPSETATNESNGNSAAANGNTTTQNAEDVSAFTESSPPPPTTASTLAANPGLTPDPNHTIAHLSSPWESDFSSPNCRDCGRAFTNLNRRHHCRLCGQIFCNDCSRHRSLVPPSSIVLVPKGGKHPGRAAAAAAGEGASFEPESDPDRMVTYLRSPSAEPSAGSTSGSQNNSDTILYGKGLEERTKLAREPLRVCNACHEQLKSVQEELRASNSNAMRYNSIDPTDMRRMFNSPLAFTLGHEVRKAAYTLNNLLPLPKKMGAVVAPTSSGNFNGGFGDAYGPSGESMQHCKDQCATISPNLGNLDGKRIPARLLEDAKGVAIMTVVKGGFGLAGFEFGTGLVVARLADGRGWSAPSAIGTAGVAWGALVGAQVSDHVFLLMTDAAIELMSSDEGSFQLGADVGVSVGPLGRSVEADVGAASKGGSGGVAMAPIYTYSLSKGLYAGASLDGKVIVSRHRVNEKFYGQQVHARDLLNGVIATPPAAQPLYDALKRCHVYASSSSPPFGSSGAVNTRPERYNRVGLDGPPPGAGFSQAPGSGNQQGSTINSDVSDGFSYRTH